MENIIKKEIIDCVENLGYCPLFKLANNLTNTNDLVLMIFKDDISLIANINKIRKCINKNISKDLDVRWDIDENGLLQVIVFKK